MSYTNLSVAEIKHSDWLLKVTWPVLTNHTSLLQSPVFMFVASDLGLLSTTGNQSASDHVTTFLRRAKILDSHLKSRSAGNRFYPPPPPHPSHTTQRRFLCAQIFKFEFVTLLLQWHVLLVSTYWTRRCYTSRLLPLSTCTVFTDLSVAPVSSPDWLWVCIPNTQFTLFQFIMLKLELFFNLEWEKTENKNKRGRDWPILKKANTKLDA